MSLHNKPLTEDERDGMELHGLPIGKPSQMSDCFRLGMAWQRSCDEVREALQLKCAVISARKDLSIREAAKEIGISPTTLCRIEAGHIPDIKTLRKVSKWLSGVSAGAVYIGVERLC